MSFKQSIVIKYLLTGFSAILILLIPVESLGIILGPYSGNLIDSRTGEPIEGASVLIYWEKAVPAVIESRSELINSKLVYTDEKGRYFIPKTHANLGLAGLLERTDVVIYKPGYQTHIVRVWHMSNSSTEDFPKLDHTVKLDRIPPNFSHKRHYERIEDSLRGLDHDAYDKSTLHREDLLRRAGWEERRGDSEDRK